MIEAAAQQFQILALSVGGFRGFYTAKVLADLEVEIGAPVATKFDLITGTSVGGIVYEKVGVDQKVLIVDQINLLAETPLSITRSKGDARTLVPIHSQVSLPTCM